MRALTLALLAAAADAAKWPLGAPHADSVPATHARLATARGDVETPLARLCGIFTGAEPVVLSSTDCIALSFTGAPPACPKFHHHHHYNYPHNCYYHFQLGFRASAPLHLHRLPLVMLVELGCARGNRGPRALARRGRNNAGAIRARADAKGARRSVAPSEDAPHVGLRRQVWGRPRVGVHGSRRVVSAARMVGVVGWHC